MFRVNMVWVFGYFKALGLGSMLSFIRLLLGLDVWYWGVDTVRTCHDQET